MLLRAAARVGVRCATIGREPPPDGPAAAGHIATPADERLPAAAEALLATAPALQWLAHELAVVRGVNPDLIRREQERISGGVAAAWLAARALHIQNESTDPAVLFVEALEQRGFTVQTLHPYAGDELPETLDGLDAVVAGGGLVDTHQAGEHPWLAREIQLVREALVRGTPYMGLCLGAQVLTEAAGGTVYRSQPHEVGWTRWSCCLLPTTTRCSPGCPTASRRCSGTTTHVAPNDGMVELMRNPAAVQALRVGDAAWGTQFHIEVTRPVLMSWLDMGGDDLAANGYPRDGSCSRWTSICDAHLQIGRTLAAPLCGAGGQPSSRLSSAAYSGPRRQPLAPRARRPGRTPGRPPTRCSRTIHGQ